MMVINYPRNRVPHVSPLRILEIVSGCPPAAITTACTPPSIALEVSNQWSYKNYYLTNQVLLQSSVYFGAHAPSSLQALRAYLKTRLIMITQHQPMKYLCYHINTNILCCKCLLPCGYRCLLCGLSGLRVACHRARPHPSRE